MRAIRRQSSLGKAFFPALLAGALFLASCPGGARAQNAPASPNAAASAVSVDVADIENGGAQRLHEIQAGETLGALAARSKVEVADIVRINPGLDPDKLSVGQKVRVPAPRTPGAPAPEVLPEPPPAPGVGPTVQYQVRPGDVMSRIAARFGVRVEDIVRANDRLDPDVLAVGQTLSIPALKDGDARSLVPVVTDKTAKTSAPLVTDFQ